ncbi:zinc finger C3H1 domain-containing protein-like isoform X3 [Labrus mixtus]|uniref:zinc finger C3H1 domain-containing protein-like isoform X3 n=1 Tax=Labrus mixtus TaxID=508554 RepID=UPI0029C0D266|nr:zinc finger C3H1 domain-containing protein-like isoform X3 [Labrus mixtus]
MDLNSKSRYPAEEGELEDGEICDDEAEDSVPLRRGEGNRPRGGAPPRPRKPHQHPHGLPLHPALPPPDFRLLMPYNRGPFLPNHRQQCGPSGPDRPPSPPPLLHPPPGLGPHGEPSPRSSFWERSHGALGRFRHRGMPNGGRGNWNRGTRGGGNMRGPPGRYGPGEIHGNKNDSPLRKQKPMGRPQVRKVAHSVSKADSCVDESFEDLLSKYKQIQLELECIRKEETMALEPDGSPAREHISDTNTAGIPENKPEPEPEPAGAEDTADKKVFQAFNIKPLRQKLPTPSDLDELRRKWAEQQKAEGGAEKDGEDESGGQDRAEGEQRHEEETEEDDKKKTCPSCMPETDKEKKTACLSCTPEMDKEKKTVAACPSCTTETDKEKKAAAACVSCTTETDKEKKTVAVVACPSCTLEKDKEKKTTTVTACMCCIPETDKEKKKKKKKTAACVRESSASSEDSALSPDKVGVKVEEEELSELQLRLLALQSASKKWQQKEQQVLKRSKDRITRAVQGKTPGPGPRPTPSRQRVSTRSSSAAAAAAAAAAAERSRTRSKPPPDRDRNKTGGARPADRDRDRLKPSPKPGPKPGLKPGLKPSPALVLRSAERRAERAHSLKKVISPGSVAKQAFRKQQLRTWKLQQQREQEEKRRQDEEERRKREEEIRRIRDLSNQDEQYNRFMKLVGGRSQIRSKSRDRDHRKSAGKQGLDASGNLYQYDNYDEVAMDTDSETSSPVPSPPPQLLPDDLGCFPQLSQYVNAAHHFGMEFSQPFLTQLLPGTPPPPPPLPPPPPEELEPPPKPPFADEEEEEEMLLRETCLMSMANKRVPASEQEMSSSAPPSPGGPPPAGVQPPLRGNLSTVSLNTVPPSRSNKFSRGHHSNRAPLVLPRHKSVVVSLIDSDDSDSDQDACSSSQVAFGGLEFMIKEARRTVEATKPKAASGSEKENNPLRTPDALPENKKAEYRLLRDEIASREKQKILKDNSPSRRVFPAVSDSVMNTCLKSAAQIKLSEAEQKLNKHRELLQRDEAMLRHLLQQELKKRESLKAAEGKVVRLREQLQASEKIVSANRLLLKKLQEQVHRVEHRVSIKKGVAVRLEQELAHAQLAAGRGPKRRADNTHSQPGKLQRVDGTLRGSEHHFAELIAQKQRLQQLESEYALKIKKLKAAQALHHRGVTADVLTEPPPRVSTPPDPPPAPSTTTPSPFPLPQPSLHDLTQDKLTLDSEDAPEGEDQETESAPPAAAPPAAVTAAAAKPPRRLSLRQSSCSFTKPNLETPSSTPAKDSSTPKPSKTCSSSSSSAPPVEVFAGLDMEAVKLRYQEQARLGELLLKELRDLGGQVDNPPPGQVVPVEMDVPTSQSGNSELKPVPFGLYRSPLLVFRSYRFSPYYRTKEKFPLSSVTFSNAIDPSKNFCRFDLTGSCNDDHCRWQHMRNCTLTGNQLFQDVLSYNLQLIGCSETSSDQDISSATERYMKKLFGSNKDRMGVDQKAVLLVSKVNESKRHVPPFTTCKDMRRWRPKPSAPSSSIAEDDSDDEPAGGDPAPRRHDDCIRGSLSALDVCVTSEDKRYFISETDDISNLETSVLEKPRDTQLWIKLAFKYLNQSDTSAAECLEAALNTLSRALESNCDNPEVWSHYLLLFSRRGSREEVQEMCEMAVEHAPDYRVWWNYLTLESSFEGKDFVCERLLQFLVSSSSSPSNTLSFHLMEALLYRVQLNLFTGRMESALAILQSALKSAHDRSIADHLTSRDRALLWLTFIHLTEFDRLPSSLYDPAESGPSRLVSRESFLLPWRTSHDISTPPDMLIALFQDGVRQCSEESVSQSERTLACLPLHTNLILLHTLLHRYDEGVSLCQSLLSSCPDSCALRDALADLHIRRGDSDEAVSMWLHALAECPNNAEVFYHCCRFLMAQEKSSAVSPLFRGFILSLCEDQQSHKTPVDLLRHILGFPTKDVLKEPIIKELQEQLSQQTAHLHLIHCRWQWLHGSEEDTQDAFERALGSSLTLEELHTLWTDYLSFSSSLQARSPSHSHSKLFSDLVHRCLCTVPSRLQVPFNPAEFWSCYTFHNKVISLYLSCLPQSQHALVLERLRYSMPNNTELGLRLLQQEWKDENMEQLKFQARMLCSNAPKCVSSWRIAITVERELKEPSEVRLLYQQALQNLPLCAGLWTDRLLFEAAEGGGGGAASTVWAERLRRLLLRCQQVGVSVSEPLSLASLCVTERQ